MILRLIVDKRKQHNIPPASDYNLLKKKKMICNRFTTTNGLILTTMHHLLAKIIRKQLNKTTPRTVGGHDWQLREQLLCDSHRLGGMIWSNFVMMMLTSRNDDLIGANLCAIMIL